ncbi:transferase [Truncatella angustata]|uniref:Transferase n=1 Tax=Truncatella angustata TaxID=152316 RepID=A0A9P8UFM8_9PEZI|nr:transferase [Truncatella angustata]KAH6648948.1 transferase [Truncatella angustata]KAH8198609.1 hypothetical protein TruAng_007241 [Truncatella angustata]
MISDYVKPLVPLIPGLTKLPPLDQIAPPTLASPILIFRVGTADARESIIQDLQDGLAKAIEEMPFLAADVVPDDVKRGTIQLEIKDGAGVWFHIRELPTLNFEVLEQRKFLPISLPFNELVPEPRLHSYVRTPVLTIQATFITGGLLLVLHFHHSIMDGNGVGIFGRVWAKHVRAVSEGLHVQEFLDSDCLDRSKIFADSRFCKELSELTNCRLLKTGRRGDFERKLLEATLAGNTSMSIFQITKRLHTTYWHVSPESMQSMKQAMSPTTVGAPFPTENSLLSALIWRHFTRARQLSSKGIKSTAIVTAVNVRPRLEPALSPDYAGNAVANAKAVARTADVEAEMPLHELASQISDSINWWTSERVRGYIAAIDATPCVDSVEMAADYFQGPDILITNNGSFNDMLNDEWGVDLGSPSCLRLPHIPVFEGLVLVLPSNEEGAVEMEIFLEEETLRRLREDKEWTAFASEIL